MKWSFTLWTSMLTLLLASPLMSQISCEYALTMIDGFGDGWNGATLTITAGNNSQTYTLDQINDDGDSTTVFISVTDGDSIRLSYTPGSFPEEPEYTLFDAEGNLIFQDGQMGAVPGSGLVFSGAVTCPSCPPPLSSTVEVERIRAFMVDISWVPSDLEGNVLIEYDTTGFSPGAGAFTTATGAFTTLVNLQENTAYDFYLTSLCSNGDTSVAIGPFSFETPYANDVGITEILSPLTGCALGNAETISVSIGNFGGVPQSLIPFDFSVNGIPGGVAMPQDGFFTGVIATDSTETTEFDATFNFSDFGEYTIQVWTALEGDSVLTNDTTTLTIVNIPEVTEYPYFEGFEEQSGGWTTEAAGAGASSWEFGTPGGALINRAASGFGAWVTNLEGSYNNNELSYLISPCLDFSSFSEDPQISFSIIVNTENNFDEAWLEVSTDNGETWSKVGTAGTGLNWYNDAGNNWWENDGGVPGWHYAQNVLEGTADSSDVRVRFAFSSDGSIVREGIGLDNILISRQLERDIAASGAEVISATNCGSPNDTISLTLVNLGSDATPDGGFNVAYRVNGGAPVVESIGDVVLMPGDEYTYTFSTTFDASAPGAYVIQAWSEFGEDLLVINDTVTVGFRTSLMPPLREDFEDGGLPAGWTVSPGVTIGQAHTSPSIVAYDNLNLSTPSMQVTTPAIGPVEESDTLTFDYRYVEFFTGQDSTILGAEDSLIVEISIDCGESFFPALVITGFDHIPTTDMTTVELSLEGLAGEIIVIRFRGVWGEGSYYLDLDNINLRRCPESLQLSADITPPSSQSAEDGSVALSVADPSGPFTYLWNNGERSKVVNNLGEGSYSVTVTNVYGCSETLDVELSVSSVRTPARIGNISLAPNPTRGSTMLNVAFTQPVDARIQLLNTVGQLIFERMERKASSASYELDLSQHSSGLYLVRIIAEGEVKTAKLVKAR